MQITRISRDFLSREMLATERYMDRGVKERIPKGTCNHRFITPAVQVLSYNFLCRTIQIKLQCIQDYHAIKFREIQRDWAKGKIFRLGPIGDQ